jgi:hypothetical protein
MQIDRYLMKHIDRGIVYIPIDKGTTKDEMDKLKASYIEQGKTVVFLRSGDKDMKTVIGELIRTRLNP